MKKTSFTQKTDSELEKELGKTRKRLHGFRFGVAGSKVRNVKEGKNIRKDIARILTELRVRER